MHRTYFAFVMLLCLFTASCGNPGGKGAPAQKSDVPGTVRLYPGNPSYLEYKGKPVILITSAEHYGALLNLDFDYRQYLETLHKEGFNYTRIFTGTYIEPVNNIFGIQKNTLAPLPGRFIAPWAMEDGKYDLTRFNPDYFKRLKDFISVAEKQGIVVEVTLFTSIYAENAWVLSPFNPLNNSNDLGEIAFTRVNTLLNEKLNGFQESFVRKVVRELNGFDNIFYEVQNEPWADNGHITDSVNLEDDRIFTRSWQKRVEVGNEPAMEWQSWIVSVIMEEEKELPVKHLIAQNISNFMYPVADPPAHVSILNFHYALPEAVILNRYIKGVIGLDETGFMPHEDLIYISQAWRFILSGGGLYNNLDYSFTAGNENGQWPIPDSNPGWGGPEFRKKLSYLARTMEEIPYYEMSYSDNIIHSADDMMKQYGLQKPGEVYLLFLEGIRNTGLVPGVPDDPYEITWINIETGEEKTQTLILDGSKGISSPFDADQVALLIRKKDSSR